MDEQLVEMVAELSAKCSAYELVLIDLIFSMWPLEVHRNERRESTCRALEAGIAKTDPSSHEHLLLLRVLDVVENLFDTPGPPRP